MSAGKENIHSLVDKIRSSRDENLKEINLLLNQNPSILYESTIEKSIPLSIYHIIALNGNLEAIDVLNVDNAHQAVTTWSLPPIDMPAVNGETALMLAAFGGRVKNVKWLLSRNASVYLKSRLGTPLLHAIWGGSFRSFKAILDCTLHLKSRKAKLESYAPQSLTFYETLRMPDVNGDTLLHHITKISRSRPKNDPSGALMARYMFELSGSDMLTLYNREGYSPMLYAIQSMNYPLLQLFSTKREFTMLRPNERAQISNADDVQNTFEDLRMADDFLEGYGRMRVEGY